MPRNNSKQSKRSSRLESEHFGTDVRQSKSLQQLHSASEVTTMALYNSVYYYYYYYYTVRLLRYSTIIKLSPRGRRDDMPPPADGSSTRGGSTSVRGRVRSPHMAKLQAASMTIA